MQKGGAIFLGLSWFLIILGKIPFDYKLIPLVLSSIASIFAIISYIYSIKKNKNKN
jgi:hypothetical protein